MIIVDTSIWIDHFSRKTSILDGLLASDVVLLHPYVLGELILGGMPADGRRAHIIQKLPPAPVFSPADVAAFIGRNTLVGSGIGYVDAHLLASATSCGATVLTRDGKLATQAERLGLLAPLA